VTINGEKWPQKAAIRRFLNADALLMIGRKKTAALITSFEGSPRSKAPKTQNRKKSTNYAQKMANFATPEGDNRGGNATCGVVLHTIEGNRVSLAALARILACRNGHPRIVHPVKWLALSVHK